MTAIFELSATLTGHEMDVKDLSAVAAQNAATTLWSVSRDKTVLGWQTTTPSSAAATPLYLLRHIHSAFINSVAAVAPCKKYPLGLVVSGGSDKLIQVSDPSLLSSSSESSAEAAIIFSLIGHTDNVCALAASTNTGIDDTLTIVSGSWDKTIRVWVDGQCIHTLQGHQAAVWDVLPLEDGQILSASADKTIKRWKNGKCVHTYTGHTDVVRSLTWLPSTSGFASCSNDGTIRVWTLDGLCAAELVGHTSFVYKVKTLQTSSRGTELVSCGEDRSLRIWNLNDATCIQTIHLPCVSVWCCEVLSNGDVACGGNDAVVRVFTRDPVRKASAEEISTFDAAVSQHAIPSNQVGDVDKTKLPGLEALAQPGAKNGQVVMVRNGNTVEAHQWDGGSWQKIGEVVDAVGSSRKKMLNNVEYDYVFDIDIGDGIPPLKLPYNVTENPYQVAQTFIDQNELPQGYLDQIANFIVTNAKGNEMTLGAPAPSLASSVDPFTGGSRYVPQGYSAPAPPSYQSPAASTTRTTQKYIPSKEFVPFKVINYTAILGKIGQFSGELEKTNPDLAFSTQQLQLVSGLVQSLKALESNNSNSSSDLNPEALQIVLKAALSWPVSQKFPALDILRMCLLYSSTPLVNSSSNTSFCTALIELGRGTGDAKFDEVNRMFVYRILSNMVSTEAGKGMLVSSRVLILQGLAGFWKNSGNINLRVAFVTMMLNLIVLLKGVADDSIKVDILGEVVEFIKAETDGEALFRSVVALGTLAHDNILVVEAAKLMNLNQVLAQVRSTHGSKDARIAEAVSEISL